MGLPSNESILKLAESHITIYTNRAGSPNGILEECIHLEKVWRNIQWRVHNCLANRTPNFNTEELNEIYDAVSCGDFDNLLKPEEVLRLDELSDVSVSDETEDESC